MNDRDAQSTHAEEKPLQGWKEIASYLERDPRTCQRWEATLGLPVRRYAGSGGNVYAYPSEIEQWRASRPVKNDGAEPESTEDERVPVRWFPWLSTAAVLAAATAVVFLSPVMNPPSPLAEAAEDSLRAELVWAEARGVSPQGDVSPDGKLVTYVDWWDGGNLAVHDLESGENRRLTDTADNGGHFASDSRISPDGKTVAYSWFRTDSPGEFGTDLMLVPLAGDPSPSMLRRATNNSDLTVQDWLPSGEAVAAVLYHGDYRNRESAQIVTVSVPGGEIRQIRTVDWPDRVQVRASPDGYRLAYSRLAHGDSQKSDIFVLATDGSSEVPAVVHEADDVLVDWSRDGGYLLFRSDRDGGPGLWAQRMSEHGPVGEPFVLMVDLDMGFGMGMTRDGSLYYPVRVTRRRLKMAELDLNTGKLFAPPENVTEQFVGRNRSAYFSPDGAWLAYFSERADSRSYRTPPTLLLRDLATGEERAVKGAPELGFGRLTWRSDSKGIWSVTNSGGIQLIVDELDIESGSLRQLGTTRDIDEGVYRWVARPEDDQLYYRVGSELFAFDVAARSVRRVLPEFALNRNAKFSVSPDGRLAASIDGSQIRVHPLDSGEARVIAETTEEERFGRWTVWAPDGSALLVLKKEPSAGTEMWRLMVAPADGSGLIPTELVYEPANAGARPLTIHPDGKRIVYGAGGYFQQIWALHNLPLDPAHPPSGK